MHRFNNLKSEIKIPFELAASDEMMQVWNIATLDIWWQEKAILEQH